MPRKLVLITSHRSDGAGEVKLNDGSSLKLCLVVFDPQHQEVTYDGDDKIWEYVKGLELVDRLHKTGKPLNLSDGPAFLDNLQFELKSYYTAASYPVTAEMLDLSEDPVPSPKEVYDGLIKLGD